MYHELYDMKTVSLRYGIVYGPREWYGRVLPIFVRRALANKPLFIFGDGEQTRDFVHVDDVVKANILSVNAKWAWGEAINVGTGKGVSIKNLAKLVSSKFMKSHVKFVNPGAGEMGRKLGELKDMILSTKKCENIFEWKPNVRLENKIDEYIEWFKDSMNRKKIVVPKNKEKLW
jgi:UDP-glucose 4-epimerase